MARASTPTLLSLDRFAQLLQYNPLHFNQVIMPDERDSDQGWSCGQTVAQYGWQSHGRVGREEIAIAIASAEAAIATELGFDVAPTWRSMDMVQIPQTTRISWSHMMEGAVIQLPMGYVLSGGRRVEQKLVADAPVNYDSKYNLPYKETATIIADIPSGLTDVQEIVLYYPGSLSGDPGWEVRPITVTIDAPTHIATITCRREQLVKPEFQEDPTEWDDVDGLIGGNFLSTVDVYRRYNEPATQARLIWNPPNIQYDVFGLLTCPTCTGGGCVDCGYSTQEACFTVHNRRLGMIAVHPAHWDQDVENFVHIPMSFKRPDRAMVWYRAGFFDPNIPRPMHNLNTNLEQAVFMLALANMSRPICDCTGIKERHAYYATDFAEVESSPGSSSSFQTGYEPNPFGTRRGCIEAWKKVQQMAIGRGVNVYATSR